MGNGVNAVQENERLRAACGDIWSFTAAFIQLVRAQDLAAVRSFLGDLRIEQRGRSFTFYTADAVDLASGERVLAFSISANRFGKKIGGGFDVANRCISHEEVKQHYPGWRVVSGPRGHSLEEQTLFQVDAGVFIYTFGFAEKAPDCLNSISIGLADEG